MSRKNKDNNKDVFKGMSGTQVQYLKRAIKYGHLVDSKQPKEK